ncbi:MAG TPA: glycosyltransferase [Nitrospira sp.]|jgi:glycosyltransferase involved in cell wall biosynthesis/phosphoheptose isomerase|nr:glycosyltransferase [Nitrospira sp.]
MRGQIALISEHASPLSVLGGVDCGGQNLYVAKVAKSLSSLGYEVDVFTRRDDDQLPEVVEWDQGIRVLYVPAGPPRYIRKEDLYPFMQEFTEYMVRFCRHQRKAYDLIHANFWMSGLVAAEMKRRLGIPFVITFHALGRVRRLHQQQADGFPDVRFSVEDRLVAEADRLIAEAPQDAGDLIRLYGADPSRIVIVPCGFDPEELWPLDKASARTAIGLPADEGIILHVGRMVPRKGIDTVIRAYARFLVDHDAPTRLLVVGGESDEPDPERTPEIGRLQRLAHELGVQDRVCFVGRRGRSHLKYYYSAADVFVTTPWYEPFGITPLEAMACGTPVIAANVGGLKFSVRDGETGYLVPPGDPDALAERFRLLYSSPTLLRVFGQQAVQRVNELFTWGHVAEGLSKLYGEVMLEGGMKRDAALSTSVDRAMDQAIDALQEAKRRLRHPLTEAAVRLGDCFSRGGRVLVYGQGASAQDAEDWASGLTSRLVSHPGWPAIALRDAAETSWNAADRHLLRQVDTLGRSDDVLVGVCATAMPPSVIACLRQARMAGLQRILLCGADSAGLDDLADVVLDVPLTELRDVRHVHRLVLHILLDLIQERMASADRRRADRQSLPSVLDWPRRGKEGPSGPRRRQLINVTGKTIPPS